MAEHESARGEHYRQRMKTRVARLGWSAASEHDGLARVAPVAARELLVAARGGADDENICQIMFFGIF